MLHPQCPSDVPGRPNKRACVSSLSRGCAGAATGSSEGSRLLRATQGHWCLRQAGSCTAPFSVPAGSVLGRLGSGTWEPRAGVARGRWRCSRSPVSQGRPREAQPRRLPARHQHKPGLALGSPSQDPEPPQSLEGESWGGAQELPGVKPEGVWGLCAGSWCTAGLLVAV